jgi:diguanylate cyclase (GGDEF)-like protein
MLAQDPSVRRFQSSLLRAIHEASPLGILVVDDNAKVVSHNRRFLEIWRIPHSHPSWARDDDAIGADDTPMLALVAERTLDPVAFVARVRELYQNRETDDRCEIQLKDGRTLERHSTALMGDDGSYLGRVWFFSDITAHRDAEARLELLARHDALTGVPNRRYFFERCDQAFARVRRKPAPISVIAIDVDHFKSVNDRYGHAIGDEALIALCRRSRPLLRQTDVFARLGGEEFCVLLPDTCIEEAAQVAERLRRASADECFVLGGHEITCTLSLGIASTRPGDNGIGECLRRADLALYRAKKIGRNRVQIEDPFPEA